MNLTSDRERLLAQVTKLGHRHGSPGRKVAMEPATLYDVVSGLCREYCEVRTNPGRLVDAQGKGRPLRPGVFEDLLTLGILRPRGPSTWEPQWAAARALLDQMEADDLLLRPLACCQLPPEELQRQARLLCTGELLRRAQPGDELLLHSRGASRCRRCSGRRVVSGPVGQEPCPRCRPGCRSSS